MKRLLIAAVAAAMSTPVLAAVGVSVNIGEPGFFGQIDIGGAPPPQVIYQQPTIIEQAPTPALPIYLHVPPGHEKHWKKYCSEYNACGRLVYFVRDDWYNKVYVPQYRDHRPEFEERHRGHEDEWHEHERHHG